MKLTTNLRLYTTEEQHQSLLKTMRLFNDICNEVSLIAFNSKEFRKYQLQQLCYYHLKAEHPEFSSQLLIQCVRRVSDSYAIRRNPKEPNRFGKYSAVVYDDRVLSIIGNDISLWTIDGRLKQVKTKQWNNYKLKGEKDLNYINGKWILSCTYEREEVIPKVPSKTKNYLGVDLGVVRLATDSDGVVYHNDIIEKKRQRYSKHRQRLQLRNTRSSKRRVKTSGKKESRFRKDVNHCISKSLIQKAKSTNSVIVLEELKNINKRVMVRKSEKNKRLSWSFYQLRTFLEYKGQLSGVEIRVIDPAYTSQRCYKCGHIDKKNRKNQASFCCIKCGHSENADYNAAKNIQFLGEQSISLLLGLLEKSSDSCSKPLPLGRGC